jgi:hypothetical protein
MSSVRRGTDNALEDSGMDAGALGPGIAGGLGDIGLSQSSGMAYDEMVQQYSQAVAEASATIMATSNITRKVWRRVSLIWDDRTWYRTCSHPRLSRGDVRVRSA